jgi:hypothetical protein
MHHIHGDVANTNQSTTCHPSASPFRFLTALSTTALLASSLCCFQCCSRCFELSSIASGEPPSWSHCAGCGSARHWALPRPLPCYWTTITVSNSNIRTSTDPPYEETYRSLWHVIPLSYKARQSCRPMNISIGPDYHGMRYTPHITLSLANLQGAHDTRG